MAASAPGLRMGVYGGAFDPPHLAHVEMAQAFMAQCELDCLWVIPTGHAWHKNTKLSAAEHRLAMVRLAFADDPRVVVDDREIRRPGPTFTVDTLISLTTETPGAQWFLLMGGDQWERFTTWHRWQAILDMATIVVAERPDATSASAQKCIERHWPEGYPAPSIIPLLWQPKSLSSTQVRSSLESGHAQAHAVYPMVPQAVARYISLHQLYTTPFL